MWSNQDSIYMNKDTCDKWYVTTSRTCWHNFYPHEAGGRGGGGKKGAFAPPLFKHIELEVSKAL